MKPMKPLHLYKEEEKKKPQHLGKEYMIFEKYDGWYGYYESGHIHSFTNRIIPSVQWLADEIKEALDQTNFVGRFVFEILLTDITDFHTLNGVLNRKSEPAVNAYLRVHDYVPSLIERPNDVRYKAARKIVDKLNHERVLIAPVLTYSSNVGEWRTLCDAIWSRGGEGIIMKQTDGMYKWGGRNSTMLKIKCECTFEAEVVGMELGKTGGKYADVIGALKVRTKDGVIHRVSGMSDEERQLWVDSLDLILGKVVECQAMQKLKDGTYREPRYKAIRHDKTVEDID